MSWDIQKFEYYIFERDGDFLAIQYTSNRLLFDASAVFNFLIQQNFSFYDADFHHPPMAIYAYNPNEAIHEAKKIIEREINQLKIELSRLRSNKEFSFKEDDAYKVFNVPFGTNSNDVKNKFYKLSKIFSRNGDFESEYMMKIINGAWNKIKKG